MLNRFRRLLSRAAISVTAPLTGFAPINAHAPDDIFVVGFPKSGNTWFQYLLSGVLCGIDASRCPDSLVQDLVPDVHDRTAYRRHTQPVFFKSHCLPRRDYRRVIYLLRDGRDAMVSYFHHYNAMSEPVDFPTLVRTAPQLLSKWHVHVDGWLANPYAAQLLIVKYEDLRRDTVGQLRRVCDFSGIPADAAQLEQASAGASFANMRQREQRLGWDNPAWPRDKPFIRRGVEGSFRDEMPQEALELFLQEAEPTLRRHGYLSESHHPVPPPNSSSSA